MKRHFLYWLLMFALFVFGAGLMQYFDIYAEIIRQGLSNTVVCYTIMAMVGFSTLKCGYLTYLADSHHLNANDVKRRQEQGWMIAGVCAMLGLVGTLIGVIPLLKLFVEIDVSNIETTQNFMRQFPTNLGTALYTTLVGIIGQIVLTLQYYNLGQAVEARNETTSL